MTPSPGRTAPYPAFGSGSAGRRPPSARGTYLSYDTVEELLRDKNLSHMNDSALEECEEYAEEADI